MAIVTLRQLLDYAAEHQFAVPAFNISNMEQVHAIMQAAAAGDSPVIMQASVGARAYAGEAFLRHLAQAAIETYPRIPVVLHQDHGSTLDICARAIHSGFSSVMMDGSLLADMKTPSTFDYNVDVTRTVTRIAHACGISVEGEIGCIGSLETGQMGKEDGHGAEHSLSREQLLTDPAEAADFVRKTKVDALAVAIGTSHGAYKFTHPPTEDILAIDHLKTLQQYLPNTHFVMHGSSSIPQDWLTIINNYGGDIAQTYGVPVDEIVEGIRYGVRKVNIDTDLRIASTGAVRQFLAQEEHSDNIDPRCFLQAATDAMQAICEARFNAFGSAGHASKIVAIKPIDMVAYYESGQLPLA